MYKIAICDDDRCYRRKLTEILKQHCDKENGPVLDYYEYSNGEDLLKAMDKLQHDVVFLDVQMPGFDGNETARLLRERNKEAIVVFCTNYYSLTPETIKVRPFRYILKDLDDKTLRSEMPHILSEMLKQARHRYITVSGQDFVRRIPVNEILYISKAKHGAVITIYEGTESTVMKCKETVGELYGDLQKEGFEYAHNSYIVNLANVISRDKQIIMLKDHSQLNIARSKKHLFEESMVRFFHAGRIE